MRFRKRRAEVPQPENSGAVDGTLLQEVGIAGYRVVRKLGAGSRSQVYLGHAAHTVDGWQTVAIKVFGENVPPEDIDAEVAALTGVRSEHIVTLADVVTLAEGRRALVLERLSGGTLGQLLRTRTRLAAGEAVTIIAPVLRAIGDLHEAGFAHGHLVRNSAMLDQTGRPVLIGLGHASALESRGADVLPARRRRLDAAMASDYAGLGVLARSVFDLVDTTGREEEIAAFLSAAAAIGEGTDPADCGVLEDLVFTIAQPVPVRLAERRTTASTGNAHAADSPRRPGPEENPDAAGEQVDARRRSPSERRRRRSSPALSEVVHGLVDVRPLELLKARLVTATRSKRKQLWFAAALSAVLLVTILSVLPVGGSQASGAGGAAATPWRTRPPSPGISPPPAPRQTERAEQVSGTVGADDPGPATIALLTARQACLASRSGSCLERVDQNDSAILDADRRDIQESRSSGTHATPDGYGTFVPTRVQRMGNSALVSVAAAGDSSDGAASPAEREPASVLVVKGEAGWRLREIFAAERG